MINIIQTILPGSTRLHWRLLQQGWTAILSETPGGQYTQEVGVSSIWPASFLHGHPVRVNVVFRVGWFGHVFTTCGCNVPCMIITADCYIGPNREVLATAVQAKTCPMQESISLCIGKSQVCYN